MIFNSYVSLPQSTFQDISSVRKVFAEQVWLLPPREGSPVFHRFHAAHEAIVQKELP